MINHRISSTIPSFPFYERYAGKGNDDDCLMMMMMMIISTDMSSIQNPSSHTEDVSGIMKWMWVELLTFHRKLTIEVLLFIRHSRYYV